jgi:hypothetical protein
MTLKLWLEHLGLELPPASTLSDNLNAVSNQTRSLIHQARPSSRLLDRHAPSHKRAKRRLQALIRLQPAAPVAICILHRRTFYRTVRAKNAAIARFRAQQRLAVRAFVEKLACVGWHPFTLSEAANRTHQHGFEKNFAHTRLTCGKRKDRPRLQSQQLESRFLSGALDFSDRR